jgi:hypothetical protein
VCWLLLLLSETVWISPTCGPVKPHGRSISDLRRRSLRVCPGTSSGITKFSEHEAD